MHGCNLTIDDREALAQRRAGGHSQAELAALERRRDKTKQIEQGMMQELLTGRRRLV